MLPTAKLILAILCGSYLLSAALLAVARYRGETVPIAVIATWAVLGIIGFGLLPQLQVGRTWVIVALAIVLGPWMAYSLVRDVMGGHWIIAITDVAGLGAIGYSLWIVRG